MKDHFQPQVELYEELSFNYMHTELHNSTSTR